MLKILKNTPNISHIVLRLYLHASDSSDGPAQGSPLINPTRLTIVDEIESFPHNKSVLKLMKTIESCVGKWDILVRTVHLFILSDTEWSNSDIIE